MLIIRMDGSAEWTDKPFANAPKLHAFNDVFRRWIVLFTITGITLLSATGQ